MGGALMERNLRQHHFLCFFDVGRSDEPPITQLAARLIAVVATMSILGGVMGAPAFANDNGLRGPWQESYKSRSRLLAGAMVQQSGDTALYAGVQLELAPKWKTYWRSPGEAGGVPPTFDWSASKNVADVTVEYPAPIRMATDYGENIGYYDRVIFPVRFKFVDPAKPADLHVDFQYGICDDICVPANVKLILQVSAGEIAPVPTVLSEAVRRVPKLASRLGPKDPRIARSEIILSGAKPHIDFDIETGSENVLVDVFVEGPGGMFIPMSRLVPNAEVAAGIKRFSVDLSKDVDIADIRGKTLRVTIVSGTGQSQYDVLAN